MRARPRPPLACPPSPGLDCPTVLVRVQRRDRYECAVLALPLDRRAVGARVAIGVRVVGHASAVSATTPVAASTAVAIAAATVVAVAPATVVAVASAA